MASGAQSRVRCGGHITYASAAYVVVGTEEEAPHRTLDAAEIAACSRGQVECITRRRLCHVQQQESETLAAVSIAQRSFDVSANCRSERRRRYTSCSCLCHVMTAHLFGRNVCSRQQRDCPEDDQARRCRPPDAPQGCHHCACQQKHGCHGSPERPLIAPTKDGTACWFLVIMRSYAPQGGCM